ncbi:MAG: hypothetical protein SFV52_13125 [Saprospiraceae bacterium]|nr:hypothetical protein [Saprospiraceae bacterium]
MPPENEILDLLARSIRQRKCALVLAPYAHTVSVGPGGAPYPCGLFNRFAQSFFSADICRLY